MEMPDSNQVAPEGQKPKSQWKLFFITFFGLLFLIGGAIWVVVKVVTFIYNQTIGSSVDSFFANNTTETIVFSAWLAVVGLFIGNLIRNG